jgi:hypothetical protein
MMSSGVLVIHVSGTHCILVGIEPAEVEAGIGIAHGHRKCRSGSIVLEIVDKVNVVSSEVDISEWCAYRYRVT